ncbi:MAG: ABC transporter ATP-binding protein/permease [Bacteroidetes bacterium]|nr:ABC transporter ATP-binding protein/permease [Rhodothermia bacterium]MCS7155627.1 ABC transporter ATP-binding protein/permease [Bacteroidota bacterium]MCX7906486.1 ABC transporter ATP-binding protein/permease [Bacteroidota bacterium]MDW8137233.1 ABC transporter ATP-binding protein [Bacteroidota bacterium]MDW8284897.1 ABC transporter ATP-binding protein [Bacteroidota bacterium]
MHSISRRSWPTIRRLLGYLRPYWPAVGLAFVLVVGVSFLGPLRPKLVQVAIDAHVLKGDLQGLLRVGLGLLGLLVLEAFLQFFSAYLTRWIGQQALFDLRQEVFGHIIRLAPRYFDRTPVGRLVTRVTSDVEALDDVFSAGVVTILGDLLRLFFIVFMMFWLSWQLALVALSVLPLLVGATFVFRKRVGLMYRKVRSEVTRLNAFLQEHLTGMAIVQLFRQEARVEERFRQINDDHRRAQIKTIFYFALFWPSVQLISSLATGLVLWYGGLNALQGALTLGVVVAFLQYIQQFFGPIQDLADKYNTILAALAASERIFEVLDTREVIPDQGRVRALDGLSGSVRFEQVWFAYTEESGEPRWVLRDISFQVEPGECVAFVGATGAGKTTLMQLVGRFYEPQRGRIWLGGVDIRDLELPLLRKSVVIIQQDAFLFSGTLWENITLGDPEIQEPELWQALEELQLTDWVRALPKGLHTPLLERGLSLSAGQRQLVALLRAWVRRPRVVILDEATANIDVQTEARIERMLSSWRGQRTLLIVAHRLSTVERADRIFVLHQGRLLEQGRHEELLARSNLYRRLYELQFQEQSVPSRLDT